VGTHEDLINVQNEISYPAVIKKPSGAMSKGVFLAKDSRMLKKISKKISFCQDFFYNFKELIRSLKYKGYTKSSSHRKKIIIQDFIPGLTHDWKILVFGKKFYVLKRYNRKNDFRASGGGRLEYTSDIPESLLNFAEKIYNALNTPVLSLDVVFDGNKNHLFEFQCIYFGTTTLEYSSFYFLKNEGVWQKQNGNSDLETEYVIAISEYIKNTYP
jgi:glutathione synthase/RimK-type ligase-like ATP-grasp enzyme